MRRRNGALGAALLIAAALAGGAALAQAPSPTLVVGTRYPLKGEPVEIRLTGADGRPLPGVEIRALYRPNSETAHTEAVGTTGASGTVAWTPDDAGVVTLQAAGEADGPPRATTQVAVRFGSFPPVGLAVMVFAAVLLFGGAGLGFWLLLKPPPHVPLIEPPST